VPRPTWRPTWPKARAEDAQLLALLPELRQGMWLDGQPRDEKRQVVLFCAESVPRYLAHNSNGHLEAGCGGEDWFGKNATRALNVCVPQAGIGWVLQAGI
jgi:hypothetical protein